MLLSARDPGSVLGAATIRLLSHDNSSLDAKRVPHFGKNSAGIHFVPRQLNCPSERDWQRLRGWPTSPVGRIHFKRATPESDEAHPEPSMPLMPSPCADSDAFFRVSAQSTRKRIRLIRVQAAVLALSVASISAALLIRAGQLDAAADQAALEAVRLSPGLTT